MTTINADMFIVPNSFWRLGDEEYASRFVREHYNSAEISINGERVELNNDDVVAQIWVCNEDSENWSNHGIPFDVPESCPERFNDYVPVRYIENLNEGESIEMTFGGQSIRLTARQLPYRYRHRGRFEEAVHSLLNWYYQNSAA